MTEIFNFVKDNQFLLTGLGLGGAGLITFWFKDIPLKVFNAIKRQITTDLIIQNYDIVFYDLLEVIKRENHNKNFRVIKINNGKWGNDKAIGSMGYGHHFIKYKNHLLFANYFSEKESISDKIKETIVLTKLGRSKKLFEEIIKEISSPKDIDKDKLKLYKMSSEEWCYSHRFYKRNIESVFVERKKKDIIFNNLDNFINKEKWYLKNGIPYQYGILFYGSPGTGKTSLIKAIASKLNYNIYYLSPQKISLIEKALVKCPEKAIVVIEDIDTSHSVKCRTDKKSDDNNIIDFISSVNLSDILNSIDGLGNVHGRILICTTNHIEKLDKALIRPGRFDLLMRIGFVNLEILNQFIKFYFPKEYTQIKKIKFNKNWTVAELQNFVLLGYSKADIINKITKYE